MNDKPITILVVQAGETQSRRLHDMLSDLGKQSEILADGDAAFERIQSGKPIDLLITELSLQGRDGLTLVAELRKRWPKRQAAAMVVTAFPALLPQAERAAPSLGIDSVLLTRSPAVDTVGALKRALHSVERAATVALAPPSKEAFSKAAPLQTVGLSRRVASIHISVELAQEEALEKLVTSAAEAFAMTGVLVRLEGAGAGSAALCWRGPTAVPAAASPEWSPFSPLLEAKPRTLLVSDARGSAPHRALGLVKLGLVGAFASVPLLGSDDRPLGWMCILDQKARPIGFGTEERELLEALAKRLGRELAANAMLNAMRQDIAAQWQMAMDREAHHSMLRSLLEALHLGVLLQGRDGKPVFANTRLSELTGIEAGALKAMDAGAFHQAFKELVNSPEQYWAGLPPLGEEPFSLNRVVETRLPRRQVLRWTAHPISAEEGPLQLNLWQDITAEVDLQAQRAGLVTLDLLTELLNRRGAEEELLREAARSKRTRRPYTLLRIFVHGLVEANRDHGHAVGDMALQAVGTCLRKYLRLPDRPARWRGREFMAILPETKEADGRIVAARVRDAVAGLDLGFPLAVCTGVSDSVAHPDPEKCLEAATTNMESARSQGPGFIL